MRSLFLFLPFVALTIVSWGAYGPLIRAGQYSVEEGAEPSSLKPFICVGIAYFLIAVLVPLVLLRLKREEGKWSLRGIIWSVIAGVVSAVGALGAIMAFKFHGDPIYVMPLVFGCAPVVNTFVTMLMARSFRNASPFFYVGVLIVAVGAAGVMVFAPNDGVKVNEEGGRIKMTYNGVDLNAENPEALREMSDDAYKAYEHWKRTRLNAGQFMLVMMFIALTALCWGAYGPIMHAGQMKMKGSRLRPFICVGLAYFLVAVLAPIPLLNTQLTDPPGWYYFSGSIWSLLGGAAGAFGVLGIIYAFNFGGKPILVMPLVFGGAPVINTLITTFNEGTLDKITTTFYLSLLLLIVGAVTVLVFAPKPNSDQKENETEQPDKDPDPVSTSDDSGLEKGSSEPDAEAEKPESETKSDSETDSE